MFRFYDEQMRPIGPQHSGADLVRMGILLTTVDAGVERYWDAETLEYRGRL